MKISDMFERNGRMSHTKTLMMIGGLTATWAIIHVTLKGALTADMLGLYLGALVLGTLGSKGVTSYEVTRTRDIDTRKSVSAKPEDEPKVPKGAEW